MSIGYYADMVLLRRGLDNTLQSGRVLDVYDGRVILEVGSSVPYGRETFAINNPGTWAVCIKGVDDAELVKLRGAADKNKTM